MWNPDIEIVDGKEHKSFLQWAYRAAWENSDDNVTKTGAVVVRDNRIIGVGYNHFKPSVKELLEKNPELINDNIWKRNNITHAETSSIEDAFADVRDAVMYMPWVPCDPCAELVIRSGIVAMYGHKELIMRSPQRWWESLDAAIARLKNNNVKLYMIEGKLGGVQSKFNNEVWEP